MLNGEFQSDKARFYYDGSSQVMSVGQWIFTLVVLAIPVVGIIMSLAWAFGDKSNENRANFCKATLVLGAIWLVLVFIIYIM